VSILLNPLFVKPFEKGYQGFVENLSRFFSVTKVYQCSAKTYLGFQIVTIFARFTKNQARFYVGEGPPNLGLASPKYFSI